MDFLVFDAVGGALNGESCDLDGDCAGARVCTENDENSLTCRPGRDCYCFPVFDPTCTSDEECDEGEECRDTGLNSNVCFTLSRDNFLDMKGAEGEEPDVSAPTVQRPDPDDEEGPSATPVEEAEESSLVPDLSPTPDADQSMVADPSPSMGPVSPAEPEISLEPLEELPTLMGENGDDDSEMASMSPDVEMSPSDELEASAPALNGGRDEEAQVTPQLQADEDAAETPPPICVDVELLKEYKREELVFERDSMARVWCDVGGNCATGGHMVVWGGRAMMMKRYCGLVEGGCMRKEMLVNSPKWKRGRRVRGRQAGGVEFTTFAARWETRAEEGVLAAAVRMGL